MDTLERLEAVNDDVDWNEILANIAGFVGGYNLAVATSEPDPESYLQGILPDYWQVVHAHNTHRWVCEKGESHPSESGYHVGIFLVGYSSLPIVLSLVEIQPREKIYFLHSQATESMCNEITARIEEMMFDPSLNDLTPLIDPAAACSLLNRVTDAERQEIEDPSNPVATFKLMKEIINDVRSQLGEDKRIALDLTGGKKTMIGGGFTAGSIWSESPKCDMFYVDSEEYDIAPGAPVPGTEFLSLLENPYNVYNVQSVREAEKLFEQHNYEAAANLWEGVEKKLGSHAKPYALEAELKAVQGDLGMANCYKLWDTFDYEAAKEHKVFSLCGSRDIFWGYEEKHTHNGIDVLDILSAVSDRETLFEEEERVIHYAVDRYQNAIRRKKSGKFYDAIVRFAQVIEMICGYKICRGIYIVHGKKIPQDFLNDHGGITTLIRFFFDHPARYRNHLSVDCNEFLLLPDYGYKDVKKVTDLVNYRHDFVHVLRATTRSATIHNTANLQQLTWKFLEDFSCSYCSTNRLSFEDLLKLHEFRSASLAPDEQLVEELNGLTDSPEDEEYAIQIYNEKLQSFEGEVQQKTAKALKAYWKRIDKWEGNLSDKQEEKVNTVQSILNEELNKL